MTRRGSNMFGVIFVTVIIISQLYDLSYAQQCTQTCTQTGFARFGQYDTVLECANNRCFELDENFGGSPTTIPNHKYFFSDFFRYKSAHSARRLNLALFSRAVFC